MSEEEYQFKIRKQFNSYCKKAIRNRSNELKRKNAERYEEEIHLDDLPSHARDRMEFLDLIPDEDPEYFFVNGRLISKKELYNAIDSLPEKKLKVIHLYYFGDLNDSEIAEIMNLSRRNTTYRRNSGLNEIRVRLESDRHGRKQRS